MLDACRSQVLTIVFVATAMAETNELMLLVGALFCMGAYAEFPLFAGLILYRFRHGRKAVAWWTLMVGIIIYAATRVLQLLVHIAFVASYDLSNFPPLTLTITLGVGFVLEAVQLYTIVIYRSLLKSVGHQRRRRLT